MSRSVSSGERVSGGFRRSAAGHAAALTVPAAFLAVALLSGCTATPSGSPATPAPLPSATASDLGTASPDAAELRGDLQPAGEPRDVATGLAAPWSIVPLESGSTLISQRDEGNIVEVTEAGAINAVGSVEGVAPQGEGGLLGLAVDGSSVYAYFTSATDNRIVRYSLLGEPGDYSIENPEVILDGLQKAGNHDGGRIKFGPDGMLYATVGDASNPDAAQDPDSLNGKILRMTPDGQAPNDNPFAGSLVYSLGHRNPQGIGWAEDGTMYAAEFGQDRWDEVNVIEPGSNYGWPIVEGHTDDGDFVNPIAQWSTDDASPSGLAVVGSTVFMAGLGGERLWVIYPDSVVATGEATGATFEEYFTGEFGRIRDVTEAPDGSLLFLTNNTDGRGSPRDGDDRLVRIQLTALDEG